MNYRLCETRCPVRSYPLKRTSPGSHQKRRRGAFLPKTSPTGAGRRYLCDADGEL